MGNVENLLVSQMMCPGRISEGTDVRGERHGHLSHLIIRFSDLREALLIPDREGGIDFFVIHFLCQNDHVFVLQINGRGHGRPCLQL